MKPPVPCCSKTFDRKATASLLALSLAFCLAACDGSGSANSNRVETRAAERGPLRITVLEGGDIESAEPITIRSEVEGQTSITFLVPEGTIVQKNDLLVKLDSGPIEQNLLRQENTLERARSDLVQAEESLEIQGKQNREREIEAETALELARNALEAYTKGKLPLELAELNSEITLREAELTQAREVFEASKRLRERDFIPQTELDRDELSMKKAEQDVEVAKRRLEQLDKWDSRDEVRKLTADIAVKEISLERVQKQNGSELKQQQDQVTSRRRTFELELEQRDKYKRQFEATEIRSPGSGLVVYARRGGGGRGGRDEPITIGTQVREREEILRIPDLTNLIVEVDIHETSIKKVRPGQRAWITVDAIPGRTFPGTVASVGLVPSSESSWMNPDLKVYKSRVKLDETLPEMKPGMYAKVQILAAEIQDAVQVPLQAVHQSGDRTFVYVSKAGQSPELRPVEVGASNDTRVEITSGLQAGELVFLSVPPGAPRLPEPEAREFLAGPPAAAQPEGGRAPGSATGAESGATGGGTRPGPGGNTDDGNLRGPQGAEGAPGGGRGGRQGGGPPIPESLREEIRNMSPEERREAIRKWREANPAPAPGAGGEPRK